MSLAQIFMIMSIIKVKLAQSKQRDLQSILKREAKSQYNWVNWIELTINNNTVLENKDRLIIKAVLPLQFSKHLMTWWQFKIILISANKSIRENTITRALVLVILLFRAVTWLTIIKTHLKRFLIMNKGDQTTNSPCYGSSNLNPANWRPTEKTVLVDYDSQILFILNFL